MSHKYTRIEQVYLQVYKYGFQPRQSFWQVWQGRITGKYDFYLYKPDKFYIDRGYQCPTIIPIQTNNPNLEDIPIYYWCMSSKPYITIIEGIGLFFRMLVSPIFWRIIFRRIARKKMIPENLKFLYTLILKYNYTVSSILTKIAKGDSTVPVYFIVLDPPKKNFTIPGTPKQVVILRG